MSVDASSRRPVHPGLKIALEMGPLVLCFIGNAYGGIYVATGLLMVATPLSLAIMWVIARRIAITPLISAALVLVFGALTIYLQDDHFIKIKATLVNGLFATALLGTLAFGKPLLPYMLDGMVALTDRGWRILTLRWGLFFLAMAVLNEVVWRSASTDTWITFKTFGYLPLTLIFALSQAPLMARYKLADT